MNQEISSGQNIYSQIHGVEEGIVLCQEIDLTTIFYYAKQKIILLVERGYIYIRL